MHLRSGKWTGADVLRSARVREPAVLPGSHLGSANSVHLACHETRAPGSVLTRRLDRLRLHRSGALTRHEYQLSVPDNAEPGCAKALHALSPTFEGARKPAK